MATATENVKGTGKDIEIFDRTTGTLIGVCSQGGQCTVSYAVESGVHHFVAFVMKPAARMPNGKPGESSSEVSVRWSGLLLGSTNPVIGPGRSVTVTAISSTAIGAGTMLQLYDADSNARLTYCAHGNSCSFTLTQTVAGARRIVAGLAKSSETLTGIDLNALSDPLTVTWLAVNLTAESTMQVGAPINLNATVNADLTNTPWSLAIMDDRGQPVGPPCKSGSSCSEQVTQTGSPRRYSAVVGVVPPATKPTDKIGRLVQKIEPAAALVNIQAQSSGVRPLHMLWGVDSCKAFTEDPHANSGLYPQIANILGAPDFWGRYISDTVCPGLSADEVYAAHNKHMGILPIYNDYNCSNVSGYDTGLQYAASAVANAHRLAIPPGRGLAIDIEPPGDACPGAANVDTGFIHGWYDGVKQAGYQPIFYGDGTTGGAFATQWCYTVAALPYIAQTSFLWSFQPSLNGGYMRSNAPGFAPNAPIFPCIGYVHAWQYQIGSESQAAPDVDGDEATSELPLWYP